MVHAHYSPVDSGGEEDEVGAHELLHDGEGDGGRLVDNQQLGLAQLGVVGRVDVLENITDEVWRVERLSDVRRK